MRKLYLALAAALTIAACDPTAPATTVEDRRLVEILHHEIPSLQHADAFAKLRLLTAWAARTVDLSSGAGITDATQQVLRQSAGETYFNVWLRNAKGTYCSGFATFFQKLVRLFGFEAYTLDIGYAEASLTHVTTLIEVDGSFYVFDPTLNGYYVKSDTQEPADLDDMLEKPSSVVFETHPVLRTAIRPQHYKGPGCIDKATHVVCPNVDTNANLIAAWKPLLSERGLGLGTDLVIGLMKHRVYSVSGPKQGRKTILETLARHGIPFGR